MRTTSIRCPPSSWVVAAVRCAAGSTSILPTARHWPMCTSPCCSAPAFPSRRWVTAPAPSRRSDMRSRFPDLRAMAVLAATTCISGLVLADQPAARAAATSTPISTATATAVDVDGTTPLHWAVYRSDVEAVKRLLKAGADARAHNDYGATPLSEAAVTGNVEIIRRLLDAGADVRAANADGQTALMIIARSANVEAAKLLLERGADVNQREQWRGQTALMWAAAEAQPEMVRLLIRHGAELDARSRVNEWERQVTAEPRMQARP